MICAGQSENPNFPETGIRAKMDTWPKQGQSVSCGGGGSGGGGGGEVLT